jgi:hypothetical protein
MHVLLRWCCATPLKTFPNGSHVRKIKSLTDSWELLVEALDCRVNAKVLAVHRDEKHRQTGDIKHLVEDQREVTQPHDGPHMVEAVVLERICNPDAQPKVGRQRSGHNVHTHEKKCVAARAEKVVELDEVECLPPPAPWVGYRCYT